MAKPDKKVKHRLDVRREVNVHLRLTQAERERVERVAKAEDRSVSSWLRKAALEALERAEQGG